MTWVKLDDGFHLHEKVLAVGGDAAWLYVCGLCHCSAHLTDGRIAKPLVARLSDRRNPEKLARALCEIGLWIEHSTFYEVRSYAEHQRSKEEVEAERVKARARKSKQRHGSVTAMSRRDIGGGHGDVTAMSRVPDTDTDTEADTEFAFPLEEPGSVSTNCGKSGSDALRAYDELGKGTLRRIG